MVVALAAAGERGVPVGLAVAAGRIGNAIWEMHTSLYLAWLSAHWFNGPDPVNVVACAELPAAGPDAVREAAAVVKLRRSWVFVCVKSKQLKK